jgi:nucleosome assembly protein 1-like 1
MTQSIDLTQDGGVKKLITKVGEGDETPAQGFIVSMHYEGRLKSNNKVFDSSRERGETFDFELGAGEVIKGWDVAVATMKKGEQATITLKPDYAYGKGGAGEDIPPNAELVFDVELVDWRKAITGEEAAEKELVENYPKSVVERVHYLQVLHDQREAIEDEENKAISEIQRKYEALYAPLYARRAEIIMGTKDVTDDEKKSAIEKFPFEGGLEGTDNGIPGFWLKAIKNSDFGDDMVHPHDEAPLRALKNVTVDTVYDDKGDEKSVKINFHFDANEYFENDVLVRSFELEDDEPTKSEGTQIKWKTGKNLSVKVVEKKQRKKGGKNQTRVVKKEEPQETFFDLFVDPAASEEEEGDEEAAARADANWAIAQSIRDDIIANAVNYYLGLVPKNDDYGFEEGDEEDDEDDEQ